MGGQPVKSLDWQYVKFCRQVQSTPTSYQFWCLPAFLFFFLFAVSGSGLRTLSCRNLPDAGLGLMPPVFLPVHRVSLGCRETIRESTDKLMCTYCNQPPELSTHRIYNLSPTRLYRHRQPPDDQIAGSS